MKYGSVDMIVTFCISFWSRSLHTNRMPWRKRERGRELYTVYFSIYFCDVFALTLCTVIWLLYLKITAREHYIFMLQLSLCVCVSNMPSSLLSFIRRDRELWLYIQKQIRIIYVAVWNARGFYAHCVCMYGLARSVKLNLLMTFNWIDMLLLSWMPNKRNKNETYTRKKKKHYSLLWARETGSIYYYGVAHWLKVFACFASYSCGLACMCHFTPYRQLFSQIGWAHIAYILGSQINVPLNLSP